MKLVVTAQGAVRFEVHVKPRARQSRITAIRDGALVVALAAPPVDGAANAELIERLAELLGVPKRDVTLERGASSRVKLVEVRGLSLGELRARLVVDVG